VPIDCCLITWFSICASSLLVRKLDTPASAQHLSSLSGCMRVGFEPKLKDRLPFQTHQCKHLISQFSMYCFQRARGAVVARCGWARFDFAYLNIYQIKQTQPATSSSNQTQTQNTKNAIYKQSPQQLPTQRCLSTFPPMNSSSKTPVRIRAGPIVLFCPF